MTEPPQANPNADLDNWFRYHSPSETAAQEGIPIEEVGKRYERIREAGRQLALVIRAETPRSADQTAAIRKVREAVFTANAALACGGK